MFFGDGNLETYTLQRTVDLHVVPGLECSKCRKFAVINVDRLAEAYGADLTLGEIRNRARCQRCGARNPVILLRANAVRGDYAWFPRPPGLRR